MEMRAAYAEAIALYRRAAQMAQGADSAEMKLLWAQITAHQAYFTSRQMRPVEAKALAEPAIVLLWQQAAPMMLQQALLAHGCACCSMVILTRALPTFKRVCNWPRNYKNRWSLAPITPLFWGSVSACPASGLAGLCRGGADWVGCFVGRARGMAQCMAVGAPCHGASCQQSRRSATCRSE